MQNPMHIKCMLYTYICTHFYVLHVKYEYCPYVYNIY